VNALIRTKGTFHKIQIIGYIKQTTLTVNARLVLIVVLES